MEWGTPNVYMVDDLASNIDSTIFGFKTYHTKT